MSTFIVVLILALIAFVLHKFFKVPRFSAVTMITGGVKSGKSALSVHFAVREYKRSLFRYRLKKLFCKIFHRSAPERPCLYSNIPLRKIEFVPLTVDILLRRQRMAYGSICLLDEASLVADSQLIKDKKINVQLMLFFKLFGHATHGGKCFVNSHCLSDLHYSLKRVTSAYYYVHHLSKFPFISSFKLREERFSDDGTVVNAYSEDVDKSLLRVLMFNSVFKKYDAYCYSVLTDGLKVCRNTRLLKRMSSLKTRKIVSFREELRDLAVLAPDSNCEVLPDAKS